MMHHTWTGRLSLIAVFSGVAVGCAGERPKATMHTGEFTEPALAERWGYGATDQEHPNKIVADQETKHAGEGAIKLDTGSGFDTWLYFPNTKDLDLDATKCSALDFWMYTRNKNGWGGDPWVILRDREARAAQYNGTQQRLPQTLKEWVHFVVPVGPGAAERVEKQGWKLVLEPGFDWQHVAAVEFHADTGGYGFEMWVDDVRFVPPDATEPVPWRLTSLERPDLTVTWAEQVPPCHRYIVDYTNPWPLVKDEDKKLKRWPAAGESVVYKVHVRNVGRVKSDATDLVCTVDGQPLSHKTEVKALDPQEELIVDVPWQWQSGAHQFEARVDTKDKLDEISKKNNLLAFQTDAYTLRATVEKGCYDKVSQVNNRLGSFSFEDWLRANTVDHMNWMFRNSTYDFAPQGTKARVRIGTIVYVDKLNDDARKLVPVDATDGGWDYPEGSYIEYCNLANTYMWALCHELTHQVGVIDNYQMDLPAQNNAVNGKPFTQPDGGSMGGGRTNGRGGTHLADMDIAGLNATYGHRRGFFGEYLYQVPERNTLTLLVDGKPAANVEVKVYQKKWDEGAGRDGTGNGTIPNTPIMTGRADAAGKYTPENRPVLHEFTTETGCTLHPNPFGHIDVVGRNGVLMYRVSVGDKWYYAFMDIGQFNVEYAHSHTKDAQYEVKLQPE